MPKAELRARMEEHLGHAGSPEDPEVPPQPEITLDDVLAAHNEGRHEERDDLVMQYCDQIANSDLPEEEIERRVELAMRFLMDFSGADQE